MSKPAIIYLYEGMKYDEIEQKISDLIPSNYFSGTSKKKTLRFVGFFSKHSEKNNIDYDFYCFPKYMMEHYEKGKNPDVKKMELIIKVIELTKSTLTLDEDEAEAEFSPVKMNSKELKMLRSDLASWIIKDFQQNGIVTEKIKQTDFRNRGYTNWSRTILRSIPITDGKNFIYPKPYHTYHQSNDEILIGQIHRCVVAEAAEFLKAQGERDITVPSHNASMLGHLKQHSSFIQKILNRAYDDKRIHSLRSIYAWCNEYSHFYKEPIGTVSFELVWERCLRFVYDNVSKDPIEGDFTFDSPVYHIGGKDLPLEKSYGIPDIIYIDEKDKENPNKEQCFMLLDAKYYLGLIDKEKGIIQNFPKYYDVSKQLYYYDILCSYGLESEKGVNAFVLPFHNLYEKGKNHKGKNLYEDEKNPGDKNRYNPVIEADGVGFRYIGYVDYDEKQSSILCDKDKFGLEKPSKKNDIYKRTVLLVQIKPETLYEKALSLKNDNEKLRQRPELFKYLRKIMKKM